MAAVFVSIIRNKTTCLNSGLETVNALISFYDQINTEDKEAVDRTEAMLIRLKGNILNSQRIVETYPFQLEELINLESYAETVSQCAPFVNSLIDVHRSLYKEQSPLLKNIDHYYVPYSMLRSTLGKIEDTCQIICRRLIDANEEMEAKRRITVKAAATTVSELPNTEARMSRLELSSDLPEDSRRQSAVYSYEDKMNLIQRVNIKRKIVQAQIQAKKELQRKSHELVGSTP